MNAGQTCVAPDYVLVDKRVEEALVAMLCATLRDFYGARVAESPDFGRIVSEGHFKRVSALLQGDHGGSVAFGGETDAATRFIAPTVIRNPRQDSALPLPHWKDALLFGLSVAVAVLAAKVAGRF